VPCPRHFGNQHFFRSGVQLTLSNISLDFSTPEPDSRATQWVELAQRVLVCARMLRNELGQQAGRWQLSEPEFSLLWVCCKAPPLGFSQNELADKLAVSAAQISGLVEQLRGAGLLQGRRAATDRRRQLWRLTDAGETTLRTILADTSALVDRVVADDQSDDGKSTEGKSTDKQPQENDWRRLLRSLSELTHSLNEFNSNCDEKQRGTSAGNIERRGAA
jgi:DNA-binding MarR family transcriptional regulator